MPNPGLNGLSRSGLIWWIRRWSGSLATLLLIEFRECAGTMVKHQPAGSRAHASRPVAPNRSRPT